MNAWALSVKDPRTKEGLIGLALFFLRSVFSL